MMPLIKICLSWSTVRTGLHGARKSCARGAVAPRFHTCGGDDQIRQQARLPRGGTAVRCLAFFLPEAGKLRRLGKKVAGELARFCTTPQPLKRACGETSRSIVPFAKNCGKGTHATEGLTPGAPVPADFQRDLRKTAESPRNRRANRPSCSRSTCHPDRNGTH